MIDTLKKKVKKGYRNASAAVIDALFSSTPADLSTALRRLGIERGDVLLVHASFGALKGFKGTAVDAIRCFQEAVGETGALLMPNQPFNGLAIDYARSGKVFDVRRTASQMGLLAEIFRRMPGVLRSVHPTHPVAVWGRGAAELIANHHRAATPCGAGSPYAGFAKRGGKMIFLGIEISVMTYFHTLEEELEPLMSKSPFTTEDFTLLSKDEHGNVVTTTTRLFDPKMSRKRNLDRLEQELEQRGAIGRTRMSLTPIIAVEAAAVATLCRERAREGRFFYDD